MATGQEPPLSDPFLEVPHAVPDGLRQVLLSLGISWEWTQWFLKFTTRVSETARRLRRVTIPPTAGAIATTNVPLDVLAGGLYRVSWWLHVTQAATVSSSATVTIGCTDLAIPCAQSGPAMTGNTTATVQSGSVLVRCDQATPINYAVAYVSVGATPMKYDLEVLVEAVT